MDNIMKRVGLIWVWVIVGLMALGGCYSVGHESHSEEEHAKIMRDMNDPEVPSQER
jgi:hypothetical protein